MVALLASTFVACGSDGTDDTASGGDGGDVAETDGGDTSADTIDEDAADTGTDVGADGADAGDSGDPDGGGPDAADVVDEPAPGDSDGDGIPDSVEGTGDTDGDGTPDYLDTDADGDGIRDRIEGAGDTDGDGTPDYLDLDSDGDGIPDEVEGSEDPDGDTLPNFQDDDSDGDGIPDSVEGVEDPDGDGIPNFLDLDADGDGIVDFWDGSRDSDDDGVPNYLDLDSDDDGFSDAVEYGQIPGSGTRPIDRDGDGDPDYVDLDSDGDGLADSDETGCPESTDRVLDDSDGDGISDLVERTFGDGPDDVGQACDPDRNIEDDVDFFFVLPYRPDVEEVDELEFGTDVRRADIVFNMDTTGSMGDEITSLRNALTSRIIPEFDAALDDAGYGVTQFDDFPCSGHGGFPPDLPLILRQRVSTRVADAVAGVAALELHSGGDYYESGFESLYQIATGLGRSNRSLCRTDVSADGWIVPPFNPDAGRVEGIADGTIGGVGFRDGSVPIVIHITDAPSHAKGEPAGGSGAPYRYGATRAETLTALAAIGAKVIGVASGTDARNDLEQMTRSANSVVPPCAWDAFRPFGCGAGQCCTGLNGAGRAPVAGVCPLVYDIAGGGTGLDNSIISGVRALISFASFDLTTRTRPDEDELADTGIDTSCFIRQVIPTRWDLPESSCVTEPSFADFNRDGVNDGFAGVTPGTQLFFDVVAVNQCVPQTSEVQIFTAYIDVVEPRGSAVLDTRLVTIVVPPDPKL